MDDSISRAAAIDALKSAKGKDPFGRYDLQNIGLDWGVSAIEKLPPVQPKRGRWVKMSDSFGTYYACSCCGEDCTPHGMKTPFCPSCGADMRGGEDEQN